MNASSITTSEIIRKLAEKGHETTLLAPQTCPKECIPDCSLACKDDSEINVIRVPTLVPYYVIRRYSGLGALILTFSLLLLILKALRICKEKKIDVVVSQHHPSHLASFSACISSSIFKLPLIVKTHDVYNYRAGVLQPLYLQLLDNINRIVFKRAYRILVVSSPLKEGMIDTYDLEKEKVLVFPNGVDTEAFRPDVSSGSLRRNLQVEGKKIILFIGKIIEVRGLPLLIKALPKIIAENSNIRVLMVGEGQQRSYVEKLAQELGVEKFVRFVNPVSHIEIPRYICISDVTVGPLVANIDTFGSVPRKVLEYMACARPVVACYGGVSSDLITHKHNGFLSHCNNVEELASIILKIIRNPKLGEEIGSNARDYVRKFHDWNRIMVGFEKVLRIASTNN